MALNEEYIRKIEFLQNNLTKRMYSVLAVSSSEHFLHMTD